MTSRSFRRLFPQLNVQSISEDEFYRQASLSQLLTGPDEQELASFRPDVKDPLELVEATPELASMLGSSLEFVDSRWDSMEASPPPTPPPGPLQCVSPSVPTQTRGAEAGAGSRTAESSSGPKPLGCSVRSAKLDVSMWEPQKFQSKPVGVLALAKPSTVVDASRWDPQKQRSQNLGISDSANQDSKMDSSIQEHQSQGSKTSGVTSVKSDVASDADANMWEPQRLRSRSAGNPDTKVESGTSEPAKPRVKNTENSNLGCLNGEVNANKNPASQVSGVMDSPDPPALAEPQRLRSKTAGISNPTKPDTSDHQEVKKVGSTSAAPKRDSSQQDSHSPTSKSIKMDAAWQRNLTNVRVHIRDLGMKVASIRRDMKKEAGKVLSKGARTKTKS